MVRMRLLLISLLALVCVARSSLIYGGCQNAEKMGQRATVRMRAKNFELVGVEIGENQALASPHGDVVEYSRDCSNFVPTSCEPGKKCWVRRLHGNVTTDTEVNVIIVTGRHGDHTPQHSSLTSSMFVFLITLTLLGGCTGYASSPYHGYTRQLPTRVDY